MPARDALDRKASSKTAVVKSLVIAGPCVNGHRVAIEGARHRPVTLQDDSAHSIPEEPGWDWLARPRHLHWRKTAGLSAEEQSVHRGEMAHMPSQQRHHNR